ncbi:glutamate synthase [Pseudorhizobium endolithicum]|uniref:Chaperone NapD n=1 Tax=Pseudorhizobium endolithicum TaxID=1191678 RepID=A0ABN7JZ78_9HYPH|nr:chaperone NapD [Pseudorhizobium endolithicum]CAD6430658.1 glutamate synthase [Rhizobium sp. Q54]CAD7048202.1 glutamate synthase [Pseudorhizobium endolithicum]
MPDISQRYHVSSAVVVARPEEAESVAASLAAMEGVEVFTIQDGKIVVVIEGKTSGELGATLSAISGLSGVFAANMVFEHSEYEEAFADERRTDAA